MTFVINEAVASCCGSPVGKCTCGNRGHNRPAARPSYAGANNNRPEPLGIPTMVFNTLPTDSKSSATQVATNNREAGMSNQGLGIPSMRFDTLPSASSATERPAERPAQQESRRPDVVLNG